MSESTAAQLERQVGHLRIVAALTAMLAASDDPRQMYEAAMDGFRQALGSERLAVLVSDAESPARFVAWRGLSDAYRRAVDGHSFWSVDDRDPQPVIVEDVERDARMAPFLDVVRAEHIRALLAIPLSVRGRVIGKCMLYFAAPHRPDDDRLRLAQTIASHVAFAIERRRSADALARSESRFRALVQHASDITTLLDADGLIQYVSPAAHRVLGWLDVDLVGRLAFDLVHPGDLARVRDAFARTVEAPGTITAAEFRFQRADGSYVRLEALGTSRLNDPDVAGVVVNSRDVTERHRLWEQLRQAQKMEAIGRLAGGIAHDFNNLLTVICGNSDIALRLCDPSSELHDLLTEIATAGERAAQLTRQLLTFSRRTDTEPQVLDLNAAVRGLQGMLTRLIGEQIDLRVDVAPTTALVSLDRGELTQIVMNLAINARDAMSAGGTLSITTHVDEPLSRVSLTVTDTGCGMDAETQSHMFEPFFSTKAVGQGTGLGLATIYGIVAQRGAVLDVSSSQGHGTSITVHFRRVAEASALEGAGPAEDRSVRRAETVLLVEDEDMVRRLAQRMLVAEGYRVLEATSGDDALARFVGTQEHIDVLLTDVVMPGMNGRALAGQLVEAHPGLKVLFMSGYADGVVGSDVGRDDVFIQKPFTVTTLSRVVRRALDARVNVGSRGQLA